MTMTTRAARRVEVRQDHMAHITWKWHVAHSILPVTHLHRPLPGSSSLVAPLSLLLLCCHGSRGAARLRLGLLLVLLLCCCCPGPECLPDSSQPT